MSTVSSPKPRFNTLSIFAFIFCFPFTGGAIVGLVLGIVALIQIRKSHERGKLLAWISIVIASVTLIFLGAWLFNAG